MGQTDSCESRGGRQGLFERRGRDSQRTKMKDPWTWVIGGGLTTEVGGGRVEWGPRAKIRTFVTV